jgi:DNA polymerase III subunit epsilon
MSQLNLNKPICFFDLETTGLQLSKDRIVEISILKVFPNGNKESKTWLVNPEMKISEESIAVHGITDKKVQNEPTFKELAPRIIEIIKGSDLAGYNSNKFDVPLLAEELLRCGYDFDLSKHKLVDVQVLFHKMEPRNLSAAYKFYCNKNLIDAHSAEADTNATYEILLAQIEKYEEVKNDIHFLSEFSSQSKNVDLAGFIQFNDKKEEIFGFGKYKGQVVNQVLEKDLGYFGWIQSADFPLYTKKILTAIKLRQLKT